MRVLVLTASYGSGHNAAARSLALAFAREGAQATVVDHFRDLVDPRFERVTRVAYSWILRHARPVWGLAYDLGNRMAADSPLTFGMTRVGSERLAALLARDRPDAVVTVHATPAIVMATLAASGRDVPPHTTVVTDFVAHAQWIAPGIDRYCVAATEVAHEFIARGIPKERVLVTGVPIRPEFDESGNAGEARTALGLAASTPVVLAMAGSEAGLGRLEDVAGAVERLPCPAQAVLVAGRDRKLAERLRRATAGRPVRVLSYIEDVRRVMAAADVLITKAGGMTLAEAIAAELPMVIYGSLPGQERRNERFASRAGIALVAHSRRELADSIERALTDADLIDHLRDRTRRLRQPHSAQRITRLVLESAAIARVDRADGARHPAARADHAGHLDRAAHPDRASRPDGADVQPRGPGEP